VTPQSLRNGFQRRSNTWSLARVGCLSQSHAETVILAHMKEQSLSNMLVSLMDAVPSNKRASELEQYGMRAEANTMVEDAEQDGWVAPPAMQDSREAEEIPSSQPEPGTCPPKTKEQEAGNYHEEDIPDIDDLELEDDEAEKDEVANLCAPMSWTHTGIILLSSCERQLVWRTLQHPLMMHCQLHTPI
jgi:hypothetical protein